MTAPLAIVFDVDNTLTPPRHPLRPVMASALCRLAVPFALAAGSDLDIMKDQLLEPLHAFGFRGSFDAFLCAGATRYRCALGDRLEVRIIDDFSLEEHLGREGMAMLLGLLERSLARPEFRLPPHLSVIGDRIIDCKSMVNLAPIGRPRGGNLSEEARRNRDAFVAFDRQSGYRRRFLGHLQAELMPIFGGKGLVVSYGGQTSFDLVVRGRDKTSPVRMLLDSGFEEVCYFGDALFEGGNDAAVLDLIQEWGEGPCPIKAVRVDGCDETLVRLQEMGLLE
jgi:hypothetical protein